MTMTMTWVRLIELSVALILAPAALSKSVDVKGFALAVSRFNVLPSGLSPAVALGTLGIEITLSVLLVAGLAEAPALAGSALLFVVFSGIAWLEGSRQQAGEPVPECGCLGGVLRLRMGHGSATLNLLVACLCTGAAIAVASSTSNHAALSLSVGRLALLAILVAGIYWLAHYALSVVSAMEFSLSENGELP